MRCGVEKFQIRGCPRNCKRRALAENHWGVPGKAASEAMTREPGDLPSAVVTREDVGRGVQTLGFIGRLMSQRMGPWFAVTCH